ncbi:(2Fe-2S)-binding protein [Desulforhopalus singaporensis]|uniref:Carbon-monoxide dehydrogenase small subunit n=1 Tax=Desulforhopalus singaporensis TaxID=91360 RepID=A0A1H0SJT6_9BACT|nr:(2Fe-2S)-binding protein [Desulforhopalus singaporensis]SDP41970.1 carbon-monoxide dehydrogenase small subunit [Desulforhopalus singaporensis]
MKKELITLTINREQYDVVVEDNELLSNVIHDTIGMTGTKYGCGTGECGACTVLVNGEPVLACITLAKAVQGAEIVTIEGVAPEPGKLDPIQEAFVEQAAIQCGFCTPGMILVAKDLLIRNPKPTEDEIRDAIRGNICRCTGYTSIVKAIQDAADSGLCCRSKP